MVGDSTDSVLTRLLLPLPPLSSTVDAIVTLVELELVPPPPDPPAFNEGRRTGTRTPCDIIVDGEAELSDDVTEDGAEGGEPL